MTYIQGISKESNKPIEGVIILICGYVVLVTLGINTQFLSLIKL